MSFQLHTIDMPNGAGPQLQDRLVLASYLNVPFPAGAAGVGTVGSVTAGTGYTFTPTITPTGGTLTAASAAGVAPVVVAGWPAIIRATMKVISATVGAGGSGYVTNDTVLFSNGIELTATASAGVVTAWAVTTAGSVTQPGGLPSVLVPISTSGVGVGATAVPVWGIGAALVDDSGNYSTLPTGYTVASVDGNGTSGAVAVGGAVTAGLALYRAIAPSGMVVGPNYGVAVSAMQARAATPNIVGVMDKLHAYAVVKVQPAIAGNVVLAGSLDVAIWA